MLCPKCNTENPQGGQFCMTCGQTLSPPDNATRKLPETDSETVRLPETDAPTYSPPPSPSSYTPPPTYTPPVGDASPPYTPPNYTPPGYSPPGAEQPAASGGGKLWASRGIRLGLLAGALILLLVAAGFLVVRFAPSLLPKGEEILLAMPQRDNEFELYMVKAGRDLEQGVLLIDDAQRTSQVSVSYIQSIVPYQYVGFSSTSFGGFVPDSNRLVYWYGDGDDVYVQEMRTREDTPVQLMKTDALPLSVRLFAKNPTFLQETRSDQARCYMAGLRQPAERLTKGDGCWVTADGSYVVINERDGLELTLSLLRADGKGDEVVVLDDQEEIGDFRVSDDGSHVLYTQNGRDGWQLYLYTVKDGAATAVGDPGFNLPQLGFLGNTDSYFYIMENDEGLLQLFVSGNSTEIAEGVGLVARSSDDGRYLIYMTADEDGEKTVASYNVNAGTSQTILSEDELQFSVISVHNTLLLRVQDGDDIILYRTDMDGNNRETLFDDDLALRAIYYTYEHAQLYLLLSEDDGYESLYTTSLNTADGFYLVEDWHDISLLNRSANGRSLVLSLQEDPQDDYVLYAISVEKGATLVKLDDNHDAYTNAVFTANSRHVIYTAKTGERYDDFDILQVRANGNDAPETLYQEAQLLDVRWDNMSPFSWTFFPSLYESVSFCPGAKTLTVGSTQQDLLTIDGARCYRYRGDAEEVVTFDVDSDPRDNYDLTLAVYNPDGNRLFYNDDNNGPDPRLTVLLPVADNYFIMVEDRGNQPNATYTLAVLEGPGEPNINDATLLSSNSRTRGVIAEEDDIYLQRYDAQFRGHFYYFDATTGQRLTLNAYANDIGSDLNPEIYLFDRLMESIASNDDGGNRNDSRLTFTAPYTGRYYLMVTSSRGDNYGSNHTYEVELTGR